MDNGSATEEKSLPGFPKSSEQNIRMKRQVIYKCLQKNMYHASRGLWRPNFLEILEKFSQTTLGVIHKKLLWYLLWEGAVTLTMQESLMVEI